MRRLVAEHPSWASPVRVIVGTRPFDDALLRDVAWLNRLPGFSSQPLLCVHATRANVGTDIFPPVGAMPRYSTPRGGWSCAFTPKPIRFWPGGPVPPAVLPLRAGALPSLRVVLQPAANFDSVEAAVRAVVGTTAVAFVRKRGYLVRSNRVIASFERAVDAFDLMRAFAGGMQIA